MVSQLLLLPPCHSQASEAAKLEALAEAAARRNADITMREAAVAAREAVAAAEEARLVTVKEQLAAARAALDSGREALRQARDSRLLRAVQAAHQGQGGQAAPQQAHH